jgi:hypothetical protein
LSVKERQATIHHLTRLRADLTGGKAELFELVDGVKNLSEGETRIFSIYGGPEHAPCKGFVLTLQHFKKLLEALSDPNFFSSLAGLIPRYCIATFFQRKRQHANARQNI